MAQVVIVLIVGGLRAKYGAAKGIIDTAQLVYPWITRDQVYVKMKILKQRGREHEALEHGSPPATGGGATIEHSLSEGWSSQRNYSGSYQIIKQKKEESTE